MAKKQPSPCKEGWRWQYGESCSAAAWSGPCNTDVEESSPCTEATGYRCACPTVLNWMGRGNTSETTQKTANHVVVFWLRKTSCRKKEKFQEVKVKSTSFKIIQCTKRKRKKNDWVQATKKAMGSYAALLAMMGSLLYKAELLWQAIHHIQMVWMSNMRLYCALKVAMAGPICSKENKCLRSSYIFFFSEPQLAVKTGLCDWIKHSLLWPLLIQRHTKEIHGQKKKRLSFLCQTQRHSAGELLVIINHQSRSNDLQENEARGISSSHAFVSGEARAAHRTRKISSILLELGL